MDVSKLPRMSQTPAPPPNEPVATGPTAQPYDVAELRPGTGAEVWLSAVVGLVVMMLGFRFARWAMSTIFGGTFHTGVNWTTGPLAGQEVAYWDLVGYAAFQDMSLFLFGLAMILEAVVLAVISRPSRLQQPLLWFALIVTVLATVLNLILCLALLSIGVTPLMSMLAVAFGGYIAMYEWKLLQYLSPRVAARA